MKLLRSLPAWSLAILLSAATSSSRAQEVFTYKTETHLIDSTVSVHNPQGGLVQGLTAADFRITEDGVPQTIRFFAHDTELPLSIGLIIDESGSQQAFVKAHEHDLAVFLHDVLEPRDQAFAVCFGNHLRLISDQTNSGKTIADALARFDSGNRQFPELGPREDRELGTALYDAIYFAATERLAHQTGRRKVLLVLSDGEENSSEHDLLDAIRVAQDNDILIYSVRYTDLHHGEMSARDRYGMRVLDHVADQTGGHTYDVQTTNVEAAFAEIAGELRSLYQVAYQSTNPTRDGRFRKVEIQPAHEGVVFRTRAGYYAPTAALDKP